MHICFRFQKKLHLDFSSFNFCFAFPASNSLQIFQLIPCKSLWDLTCLVRSHKDLQGIYWMICNEFMHKMQSKQKEKKKNVDEVFFERGNKYAWDKCKSTEKNTRELHLELVGAPMLEYIDLGVKWDHLIIGHTHRLSSKWVYHFLFKHLDVFTSCRVALAHDLE